MRTLCLIIAVAGAYILLRGWNGSPGILLRSCFAVATLVAGLAFWSFRKNQPSPRMFCTRRATWLDYLSLAAAIIFTEACFVAFTSTLAATTQEFTDAFYEQTNGIGLESENEKQPTNQSGNWLFSNALERNLPPESNHKPSNKPEVFVELDNKQDAQRLLASRMHLRSFTMSRFNNNTWSARKESAKQLDAPVIFSRPDHNLVTSPVIKHKVYHAVNPTSQNVLVTITGAINIDISPLIEINDSIHLLPFQQDTASGYQYTVTSKPVSFTDLIGRNPEIANTDATYLALANNPFTDKIRSTAAQFKNTGDLTAQLIALRVHLQENYTYSLKTTNASGVNPIENFLYQEKRGYCEHFATATVLICRALGIPSRIAYGWSGGKLFPAQNMFVFRARDAHAWAEIKLKGYGWVTFDTTPPDANNVPTAFSASDQEQAPDPQQATSTTPPETENDHSDSTLTSPDQSNVTRMIAALLVLGLCCAGFLFFRHLGTPETDAQGRPVTTPTPSYLTLFKHACASAGTPMPQGRTLKQHIHELIQEDNTLTFAQELLDYHYSTLYGNTKRNPSREKNLTKAIREWGKSHKAAQASG